jgi:hypothetical protein
LQNRSNKKKNYPKRKNNNKNLTLYRQINEVDYFVVDDIIGFTDAAAFAIDIFSSISTVTDYTNLQVIYGEFKWISLEFLYIPYLTRPLVATDAAVGAFAVQQGKFNLTPGTLSLGGVVGIPGSFLINNSLSFRYNYPLANQVWYPCLTTNTITSMVPKLALQVGYGTASTTNSNKGLLLIRVNLAVRSKLE